WRRLMVPPRGVFDRRTVGYEDELILRNVNSAVLPALNELDPASPLALWCDVEDDVGDLRVIDEVDAFLLKPLDQRQDQGVVLVEAGGTLCVLIGHSSP